MVRTATKCDLLAAVFFHLPTHIGSTPKIHKRGYQQSRRTEQPSEQIYCTTGAEKGHVLYLWTKHDKLIGSGVTRNDVSFRKKTVHGIGTSPGYLLLQLSVEL